MKKKLEEKPVIHTSLRDLREESSLSFESTLMKLDIDEFFTKDDKKQKYNKFINSIVPEEDFNFQADLIEMPTTSEGYKWILTVVDLATNEFDLEPMKNKESVSTVKAFQAIMKRKILGYPDVSIKTDGGTEFKGAFRTFIHGKKIMLKTAMPYRKQQMGPVEGLNKTVTRILMNYLNSKSQELNKEYHNWTDILPQLREEVNQYRKRDLDQVKKYQGEHYFNPTEPSTYNIGDFVHFKMNRPTDIQGRTLNDGKFRAGDRRYSIESREIVDILNYNDDPYYRYKLKDMPHVSYSEYELKPSQQKDNYYVVKKIIGKKTEKKIKYYLIHWKGQLKKKATWEKASDLIEDGLEDEIKEFDKMVNRKRTHA
jgi:hypothetical protein